MSEAPKKKVVKVVKAQPKKTAEEKEVCEKSVKEEPSVKKSNELVSESLDKEQTKAQELAPEAFEPKKAPVYKQWWFWLLVAMLGIVCIAGIASSGNKETANDSVKATSIETSTTMTTTTTAATVPVKSIVQTSYEKVCSLNEYSLVKKASPMTGTIFYYYNRIPIDPDDAEFLNVSWNTSHSLNQGAIYRAVVNCLKGFDMGVNNGSYYSDMVFGIKDASKEELEPYVVNASQFICENNAKEQILKKLESLGCVNGTFDYPNNNYQFTISDLVACANEMKISEEMLGYVFGVFAEYDANIEFQENSCSIMMEH